MGNLSAKVYVSMTRDYGITTVTFALESDLVPVDGNIVTNDLLTAVVLRHFTHFEENTLKEIKGAALKKEYDEEWQTADRIAVGMVDGKRMYNVIGGRFQQRGVPFYEEHMKEGGYNPKEIPDDGVKLPNGTKMLIQFENGKARRVLKLAVRT